MATSTKIQLTANEKPAFFVAPLREDSAEKASELLQENHEKHHIYFNNDGFHVSSHPSFEPDPFFQSYPQNTSILY